MTLSTHYWWMKARYRMWLRKMHRMIERKLWRRC